MNQYGQKSYWEERYQNDAEPFEWYQRYITIKPLLLPVLAQFDHPRVLSIGCGTSRLSEDLYAEGVKQVHGIDYSDACIRQMQDRYSEYQDLKFSCMDCRNMGFEEGHFDVVFDKGTLDSILCSENASDSATQTLQEIQRVLSPRGVFFCISHGIPDLRLPFLKNPQLNWTVEVQKLPKPGATQPAEDQASAPKAEDQTRFHYVYTCRKGDSKGK